VARDATVVQHEHFDPLSSFDYQHESMLQVEAQNHKACLHMTHLGFNGDVLKRTARRRVNTLLARVSTMSSEEERIMLIVGPAKSARRSSREEEDMTHAYL
jgi:hypothetical protein